MKPEAYGAHHQIINDIDACRKYISWREITPRVGEGSGDMMLARNSVAKSSFENVYYLPVVEEGPLAMK